MATSAQAQAEESSHFLAQIRMYILCWAGMAHWWGGSTNVNEALLYTSAMQAICSGTGTTRAGNERGR